LFASARERDSKEASGEAGMNSYSFRTEAAGSRRLVSLETKLNKVLSKGDRIPLPPQNKISTRHTVSC